ncbi:hypothetical protein L195_g009312 [Trifolium pratense]|uniref:Uncharacterized protein n=1 Tax=Trifolium pratense TaxID=57577 RepID=A0A2K3PBL6_TRIPR|nr:hypothetical protein L195_g015816 [Trifolium pratense]PNY12678.1 hypothetical protein L195_g009312 [Trifolium pratense]
MAPDAVLEVAIGRRAMWWRGSRQLSPVWRFLSDLLSPPVARIPGGRDYRSGVDVVV